MCIYVCWVGAGAQLGSWPSLWTPSSSLFTCHCKTSVLSSVSALVSLCRARAHPLLCDQFPAPLTVCCSSHMYVSLSFTAETDRATNKCSDCIHMPARRVHFWYLTGALRKIIALPLGISSSGSVSFWLINISYHISLSSSSKEMMQNESRQIKTEHWVVIKAITTLPFSHLNTTNTAKKKNEAPQWVSAAPCSSDAAWTMTIILMSLLKHYLILEVLLKRYI